MNETKSKLSRRNFLIAAGAGGAAAVAAIASRVAPTDEPQTIANNDNKRRGKGYQESAHVRSYYHTAKV
jgi:secreted PhoX family phosphatase